MIDYPIFFRVMLLNKKVLTLESNCDEFGEFLTINDQKIYYYLYNGSKWVDVSDTIKKMHRVCSRCLKGKVDDLFCEGCK